MIGSAEGTVYANSLQMIANAVDWSLEDRALLAIRSRGHFNRTLPPLEESQRVTLEYSNYALAASVACDDLRHSPFAGENAGCEISRVARSQNASRRISAPRRRRNAA